LLLDPGESLPLRLAGGVEALRVERQARLGPRHQPLLPVAERLQLRGKRLLRPLDVGVQLAEALRHALLHLRERLAELRAGPVLAFGERRPPLLRDPPLLGDELRQGVGAGACERPLELRGAGVGLGGDHGVEAGFCLLEPLVDLVRTADEPLDRERAELEGGTDCEAGGRDRELARRFEREHDPPHRRRDGKGRSQREEEPPRRASSNRRGGGCKHDDDRSREHELEDLRAHRRHAMPGEAPAAPPRGRRLPRPASGARARGRP
jgi:hypothetical protein